MKEHLTRMPDIARAFAEALPRLAVSNVQPTDIYVNAAQYRVWIAGAKLRAILECECIDGELWLHLSVSGPKRLPLWRELSWCKDYFLGDRKAVQVLPPKAEYINIHPHVLHLYAPLERDPLPDFRMLQESGQYGI